ncbi:MAG TPA: hypothetical protein VFW75_03015 [Acetobacteraceae bacterium]|nr:hypothetical protein [Acetobacteraceae bacterium]
MHLLLGNPDDPFCLAVRNALEARNCPTRVIANPLTHPSCFAWRLDSERSSSRLAWNDEAPILSDQIAGVLVRHTGWIDAEGWNADDLAYVQSETQAALLAWLWSLPCPVVNRLPPALWYRPQVPLLSWQPLLRRCGLPALEMLVTNVDHEARDFGRRLAHQGVAGVVYGPLTSDARYLVANENDWNGLAALEDCAPVCLASPHGAAQFVCMVGEQAVWDGKPAAEATALEPALRRFAKAAGLAIVELALAATAGGVRVIAVECHPNLPHFSGSARQAIVAGTADLLMAERPTA